jgi:hypothetical protein
VVDAAVVVKKRRGSPKGRQGVEIHPPEAQSVFYEAETITPSGITIQKTGEKIPVAIFSLVAAQIKSQDGGWRMEGLHPFLSPAFEFECSSRNNEHMLVSLFAIARIHNLIEPPEVIAKVGRCSYYESFE